MTRKAEAARFLVYTELHRENCKNKIQNKPKYKEKDKPSPS